MNNKMIYIIVIIVVIIADMGYIYHKPAVTDDEEEPLDNGILSKLKNLDTTTILIIVGILIAAAVFGYFYFKSNKGSDLIPKEIEDFTPTSNVNEYDYYQSNDHGHDYYKFNEREHNYYHDIGGIFSGSNSVLTDNIIKKLDNAVITPPYGQSYLAMFRKKLNDISEYQGPSREEYKNRDLVKLSTEIDRVLKNSKTEYFL